ncbi:MAG: hypothetical protein ABF649_18940 [Bacillus sp. (in: firmicutes)]
MDLLKDSCYVEIKPGKYTSKHWNKESIYFTDETFTYLTPAIIKHYKRYSLWGMSEINRQTWSQIIAELERIKLFLINNPKAENFKNQIGYLFETTQKNFTENLHRNIKELIKVITEFQSWIAEKLKRYEYVSILGI